jgi:hypothetical protein
MAPQSEEAFGAVAASLDVYCCAGCSLFWFDRLASIRLTPRAVLALFQYIGQAGAARNVLATAFACPRCNGALSFTHDIQRATHFTYWRCLNGHGQLITFNQFLAEKNFIRAPSADELAKLRDTVRQISCSQCGGPVDLTTESACPHCGAPITLIDSDGVAKALQDLAAGASANPPAPDAARTALADAQIDALFNLERIREREGRHDLLSVGTAAIGALLNRVLLSR